MELFGILFKLILYPSLKKYILCLNIFKCYIINVSKILYLDIQIRE